MNVVPFAIVMLTGCGGDSPRGGEGGKGSSSTTSSGQGTGGAAQGTGGGDQGTGGGFGGAPASMQELFALLGPKPLPFKIDAKSGGVLQTATLSLTIPPLAILDKAGVPLDVDTDGDGVPDAHQVTGPVALSLREFRSVGDMVRGGRPTLASDGSFLESSGAFELDATTEEGKPLVVQDLAKVTFHQWDKSDPKGMGMWLGKPGSDVWVQPKVMDPLATLVEPAGYYFDSMPMGSIGGYTAANCDKIVNLAADHMTLRVKLAPQFVAQAGVFFLPSSGSTAVKLYTKAPSLPGFVSYPNTMPVGVQGKLIVVSLVAGSYYLFHDDAFTIPTGVAVAGVKEATITPAPVAVSQAAFMSYMNGL
jgi:hypothetical protein